MIGKHIKRSLFFAAIGTLLQTCPIRGDETYDEYDPITGCKLVDTVPDFDIDVYADKKWHVQQQMENEYLPLENNYCSTAEYNVRDTPTFPWGYTVDVLNLSKDEDGLDVYSELCAYQTGKSGTDLSKLGVSPCFLPKSLAGPYWVVAYDEEEGYALVSGGQPYIRADPDDIEAGCQTGTGSGNSGLWILTREQTRDDDLVEFVRMIAKDAGFDLSVLNDVDHTNCDSDDVVDDFVCEDSDNTFELKYVGTRDCKFVDKYSRYACISLTAQEECPKACGICE